MTHKHERIKVVWKDAHTITQSWTALSELRNEHCLVESVGFLIHNIIDDHIVIAQSINPSGEAPEYDGVLAIPLGTVISIENLVVTQRELFV
jgi:hypothetical protein